MVLCRNKLKDIVKHKDFNNKRRCLKCELTNHCTTHLVLNGDFLFFLVFYSLVQTLAKNNIVRST